MNKQLVCSSQRAYVLSLNIISQDENEYSLTPVPLIRLTRLIMVLWSIFQTINRTQLIIYTTIQTITQGVLAACERFYLLVEAGRKPWLKTLVKNPGGLL